MPLHGFRVAALILGQSTVPAICIWCGANVSVCMATPTADAPSPGAGMERPYAERHPSS